MTTPLHADTCDNQGAVELSKDRKACNRSRHILRRYFKVREFVHAGEIEVKFVPTAENRADMFTKALPPKDHMRHKAALMTSSKN